MLKIGLTGGIGSGKTTIAQIFSALGYPVYLADPAAARLINHHMGIREQLIHHFGTDIYRPDGTLDKKKLASFIFHDRENLLLVNHIVHPRVTADFLAWCKHQHAPFVLFESAILFEAGLTSLFDKIICVQADLPTRIRRVMKRDNTTPAEIEARIKNQMDDSLKCREADYILYNNENTDLLPQILSLADSLKNE